MRRSMTETRPAHLCRSDPLQRTCRFCLKHRELMCPLACQRLTNEFTIIWRVTLYLIKIDSIGWFRWFPWNHGIVLEIVIYPDVDNRVFEHELRTQDIQMGFMNGFVNGVAGETTRRRITFKLLLATRPFAKGMQKPQNNLDRHLKKSLVAVKVIAIILLFSW